MLQQIAGLVVLSILCKGLVFFDCQNSGMPAETAELDAMGKYLLCFVSIFICVVFISFLIFLIYPLRYTDIQITSPARLLPQSEKAIPFLISLSHQLTNKLFLILPCMLHLMPLSRRCDLLNVVGPGRVVGAGPSHHRAGCMRQFAQGPV